MLYADYTGIVTRSRNNLAEMMADIVAVCASFGLTVSEAKTENMCLITKGDDRVAFDNESAGQVYKQTAKFVCLGVTVCDDADRTIDINRHVIFASLRIRRYDLPLYDQATAPLRLKVWMLNGEVMETMLYGCVTWSPNAAHFAKLHQAHRRLLLRCTGWKRNRRGGYHVPSYADAIAKTGCKNICLLYTSPSPRD